MENILRPNNQIYDDKLSLVLLTELSVGASALRYGWLYYPVQVACVWNWEKDLFQTQRK